MWIILKWLSILYALFLIIVDLCPPGHNSTNGFIPCQPCPKYYYQSEYGAKECIPCTTNVQDNVLECFDTTSGKLTF